MKISFQSQMLLCFGGLIACVVVVLLLFVHSGVEDRVEQLVEERLERTRETLRRHHQLEAPTPTALAALQILPRLLQLGPA